MKTHRLDGSTTTLLLLQRGDEIPEIVHWGARLPDALRPEAVAALRDRATRRNGLDEDHVEAVLMPSLGTGALRSPALAASRGYPRPPPTSLQRHQHQGAILSPTRLGSRPQKRQRLNETPSAASPIELARQRRSAPPNS